MATHYIFSNGTDRLAAYRDTELLIALRQSFLIPDRRNNDNSKDHRTHGYKIKAHSAVAVDNAGVIRVIQHRDGFADLIGAAGLIQLPGIDFAFHSIFHGGGKGIVTSFRAVISLHIYDGGCGFYKTAGFKKRDIDPTTRAITARIPVNISALVLVMKS